jgi:SpoVK/Ycf46/Vps4 family AAA+-type ATPase
VRAPATWDPESISGLRDAGRYDEAAAVLRPLYDLADDKAAPEALITGHWLALVDADAGRADEAVRLGREVLAGSLKTFGPDDPDTLTTQSNLGIDLYNGRDVAAARDVLRAAYEGRQRRLGDDDPDTLWTGHWLAMAEATAGDLDEAVRIGTAVFEGRSRRLGVDNPATLMTESNLGLDLSDRGDPADAVLRLEDASARWRRQSDDSFASWSGFTDHWLAVAYKRLGRFEDAVRAGQDAFKERSAVLGESDAATWETGAQLGANLLLLGRFTEAADVLGRAYEHQVDLLGEGSRAALETGYDYAVSLAGVDDFQRAIDVGSRLLERCRHSAELGPADPGTARCATVLGIWLQRTDQHDAAIALLEPFWAPRDGERSVTDLSSGTALAMAYAAAGRLDDAIDLGRAVWTAQAARLGAEHPFTLVTAANLGVHLLQAGRAAEARDVLDAAYRGRRHALGPEDAATLLSGQSLATAEADAGDTAAAAELASEVLVGRMHVFGVEHPALVPTEQLLDRLGVDWRPLIGLPGLGATATAPVPDGPPPGALAELDALIGLAQAKAEVHRKVSVVRHMARRRAAGLKVPEVSNHMLFVGHPGTGKTTVARLVGRIFAELGVVSKGQLVEAKREKLVGSAQGETAKNTTAIFESAKGGVLFLDEAYNLSWGPGDDLGQEAINTLTPLMEDYRDEVCVVAAGYEDRMVEFLGRNEGLASRFRTTVHFEDYTDDELVEIFGQMCAQADYGCTDDATARLREVLRRWPRGRSFGNARLVRNLFEGAIERSSEREEHAPDAVAGSAPVEAFVADDIPGATTDDPAVAAALGKLDALVGLGGVKAHVREMVLMQQMDAERRLRGLPVEPSTLHLCFVGHPGTGKTTVAGLIGEIYAALGLLPTGVVRSATRDELIGAYQGQTAKAVRQVFDAALGGLLFIDEVYSLVSDEHDTFGREAVDLLNKLMEDHREEICVVVAGYPGRMREFLRANPGLASRFAHTIEFEDYSDDQLVEIFLALCANGAYVASDEVRERARAYFAQVPRGEDFGNARAARNLYDDVRRHVASRLGPGSHTGADLTTLRPDDIGGPLAQKSGSGGDFGPRKRVPAAVATDVALDRDDLEETRAGG